MNEITIGLIAILMGAAFSGSTKKKKKKKTGGSPFDPGGGGGGGGGGDDDSGFDRETPWEKCPKGWYAHHSTGEIICEDIEFEDPDDMPSDAIRISPDCDEVIEGADFFDLLVQAGLKRMDVDFENFGDVNALMRELLVYPDADDIHPYAEPECIAMWPDFRALEYDVPGGPWDSSTDEGYAAYLEAWEDYDANWPLMGTWLYDLQLRLFEDETIGPLLNEWLDRYDDGTWVFNAGT